MPRLLSATVDGEGDVVAPARCGPRYPDRLTGGMIGSMAMAERPRPGVGCLATVIGVLMLVAIVAAAIFVGVVVLGVIAAVLVVGLLVLAADRVMLALSPRRRERRAAQQRTFMWRSGLFPSGPVIETTATDATPTGDQRGLSEGQPDEGNSE